MMIVHLDDHSMPQFPEGWEPFEGQSSFFHEDAVVWILREVA